MGLPLPGPAPRCQGIRREVFSYLGGGRPRGHAAGRKLAAGYSEKYAGKRRGFFLRR